MKICLSFIFAVLISLPAMAGLQTQWPEFDQELAQAGVSTEYSATSYDNLVIFVDLEVNGLESESGATEDSDRQEKLEMAASQLKEGLSLLKQLKEAEEARKANAHESMLIALYSARADLAGRREAETVIEKIGTYTGKATHLFSNLAYLAPEARNRVLTDDEIAQEASILTDYFQSPPRTFANTDELKGQGFTVNQLAKLDVNEKNPMAVPKAEVQAAYTSHGSPWERFANGFLAQRLKQTVDPNYDFNKARRVLFFHKLKTGATSPKFDTKDAFKQKWKVKFGEEIHTESLANRLYMAAGGRFTDLVFANQGGIEDMVLILNSADEADGCKKISEPDKLRECLLSPESYNFDIQPYVSESGRITQSNIARVMGQYLPGLEKARQKYLGRYYMVFNESLVEFKYSEKHGFSRRDSAPYNNAGALTSRAKRGMSVFNYWINNKDAKDDNSKTIYDSHKQALYEYQHDLGMSLGWTGSGGNMNKLRVGQGFATLYPLGDDSSFVRLFGFFLYRPKAWDRATQADVLWGLDRILSLPRSEIEKAVAGTKWPQFAQEVMVNRLLGRRNRLAEVYGLDDRITPLEPAKTRKYKLEKKSEREAVVSEFRLSLAADPSSLSNGSINNVKPMGPKKAYDYITSLWSESGQPKHDQVVQGPSFMGYEFRFIDRLMRVKDHVAKCSSSIIVRALESTVRPSGLSRRTSRHSDDIPLNPEECKK